MKETEHTPSTSPTRHPIGSWSQLLVVPSLVSIALLGACGGEEPAHHPAPTSNPTPEGEKRPATTQREKLLEQSADILDQMGAIQMKDKAIPIAKAQEMIALLYATVQGIVGKEQLPDWRESVIDPEMKIFEERTLDALTRVYGKHDLLFELGVRSVDGRGTHLHMTALLASYSPQGKYPWIEERLPKEIEIANRRVSTNNVQVRPIENPIVDIFPGQQPGLHTFGTLISLSSDLHTIIVPVALIASHATTLQVDPQEFVMSSVMNELGHAAFRSLIPNWTDLSSIPIRLPNGRSRSYDRISFEELVSDYITLKYAKEWETTLHERLLSVHLHAHVPQYLLSLTVLDQAVKALGETGHHMNAIIADDSIPDGLAQLRVLLRQNSGVRDALIETLEEVIDSGLVAIEY